MQSLWTVIYQYLVKLNIHVTMMQQSHSWWTPQRNSPHIHRNISLFSFSYASKRVGGNYMCLSPEEYASIICKYIL